MWNTCGIGGLLEFGRLGGPADLGDTVGWVVGVCVVNCLSRVVKTVFKSPLL